ncbi:MAG: ribonuclease P protein component [Clostridia bacterium]|nr:ribonuclease P protein component [Clostridia bacterium]
MLNKQYRLKKRKEFAYMYRKGDASHTKYLTLVVVPTKMDHARVGFSVSKKVGKAYKRNLIKRQLTEIIKTTLPHMDAKYNYIVIAKPSITELNFAGIREEVLSVLKRSGHYE